MRAEAIPIIRLQVESMKLAIASAMGLHDNELGDAINDAVEKAINEFDFEGTVSKIADVCITECIQDLFEYGGAGRSIIKTAIAEAFDKIFKEPKA